MKVIIVLLTILFLIFTPYTSLFSDILYLKNGGEIEGIITEKDDHYIVDLGYGTANFAKDSVIEVKYSSVDEKEQLKNDWSEQKEKMQTIIDDVHKNDKSTEISKNVANYKEVGTPGQRTDIINYIIKGKITIFDFYSPFCGPCRKIAPKLEALSKSREDIVVRKININRSSVHGIDWQSPVVKQYKIKSVPSFRIYDKNGNLWLEGKSAYNKIYSWL